MVVFFIRFQVSPAILQATGRSGQLAAAVFWLAGWLAADITDGRPGFAGWKPTGMKEVQPQPAGGRSRVVIRYTALTGCLCMCRDCLFPLLTAHRIWHSTRQHPPPANVRLHAEEATSGLTCICHCADGAGARFRLGSTSSRCAFSGRPSRRSCGRRCGRRRGGGTSAGNPGPHR